MINGGNGPYWQEEIAYPTEKDNWPKGEVPPVTPDGGKINGNCPRKYQLKTSLFIKR